jgi:hypothetical protein
VRASARLLGSGFAVSLVVALLVPAPSAHACAGCRNPNVTPSRAGGADSSPARLTVTAALDSTALWVSHPAGCDELASCTEVPVQPRHSHDLFILPMQLSLGLDWSVTEAVGLEVQVPLRLVHLSASYETPDGRPYRPLDEGIHHRDETLVGPGDPLLGGRATFAVGRWWLTGRLGVTVPLGSIEENPFVLGDAGVSHQHVQLGTGTFDPALGLEVAGVVSSVELSLYGHARVSLYDNRHGYRAGPRGLVGLGAGLAVAPEWTVVGLLEGAFEGAETWDGAIHQDGMLGRHELLLGAQVRWRGARTMVTASLRTPLYRHIVPGEEEPGELTAPLIFGLSAGWSFL